MKLRCRLETARVLDVGRPLPEQRPQASFPVQIVQANDGVQYVVTHLANQRVVRRGADGEEIDTGQRRVAMTLRRVIPKRRGKSERRADKRDRMLARMAEKKTNG